MVLNYRVLCTRVHHSFVIKHCHIRKVCCTAPYAITYIWALLNLYCVFINGPSQMRTASYWILVHLTPNGGVEGINMKDHALQFPNRKWKQDQALRDISELFPSSACLVLYMAIRHFVFRYAHIHVYACICNVSSLRLYVQLACHTSECLWQCRSALYYAGPFEILQTLRVR
jgi:hypothetical protein